MFLGYLVREPAATMILQEVNEVYLSSVAENESLFLHKRSVRCKYARSGLPKEMVIWAKNEANNRNKNSSI